MEEGGESNQRVFLVGSGKEFYAPRMAPKKQCWKGFIPQWGWHQG